MYVLYISSFFLFLNYKITSVLLLVSKYWFVVLMWLREHLVHSLSKLQNYVCLLTALEAHFVPFQSTGNPLFCSINGFATFRAFWMFHGLERHFYTEKETLLSRISYCTEISRKVNYRHIKSKDYCSVNYYFLLLNNWKDDVIL